ncbi:Akap7 [Columba livia]|nr:Akap7 [Columba livia]
MDVTSQLSLVVLPMSIWGPPNAVGSNLAESQNLHCVKFSEHLSFAIAIVRFFRLHEDGLENVQQIKIFEENKKKTQEEEEPCPADSVDSLMAEMPFVDTDIEDEFVMHATSEINIKKKRKRTTGKEIEEGSETKKKKKRQYQPNYFISLPITNPEITGSIQALQDAIIQKDQRLSKAMVRSGSLHVTMLVMHLSNEEDVSIAVGALSDSKGFVEDLLKGKTVDLSFQGIDHFRNEVGFVKLAKKDHTAILTEIAGLTFANPRHHLFALGLFFSLYTFTVIFVSSGFSSETGSYNSMRTKKWGVDEDYMRMHLEKQYN